MNLKEVYLKNIIPNLSMIINELIVISKYYDKEEDEIKKWIFTVIIEIKSASEEYSKMIKKIAKLSNKKESWIEHIFPYYFDHIRNSKLSIASDIVVNFGDVIDFERMEYLYNMGDEYIILCDPKEPFDMEGDYIYKLLNSFRTYQNFINNFNEVLSEFTNYHPKSIYLYKNMIKSINS